METLQIRLTKTMLDKVDELITIGEYPNRSEAIRDSVRRMLDCKSGTGKVLMFLWKTFKDLLKLPVKNKYWETNFLLQKIGF